MTTRLAAAVLAVVGCAVDAGAQSLCGPWQWAVPLPQGNHLRDVTYGNGVYVAVGDAGTVLVSADAVAWTVVRLDSRRGLAAVTWDGSRFVAVGDGGTVAVSPDGRQWVVHLIESAGDLLGVAAGGGRLVAVGRTGAVFGSLDGSAWEAGSSGTTVDLGAVTWTGTRFVAAERQYLGGPDPLPLAGILTSPAGAAWTRTTLSGAVSYQTFASDGSRLLLAGSKCVIQPIEGCGAGALVAMSEDDGASWSVTEPAGLGAFTDVLWAGSRFLALHGDAVVASLDGVSWVPAGVSLGFWPMALGLGDAGLVAVGGGGGIATSTDGTGWTPIASSHYGPDLADVVWTGTRFVAVGPGSFGSAPTVRVSADGLTWTAVDTAAFSGRSGLSDVAWSGARLAAIGATFILSSVDGLSWSVVAEWDLSSDFWLSGVAWTGTRFVAVGWRAGSATGFEGMVMASADGTRWTEVWSVPGVRLWDVAGHAGTAVVTGNDVGGADFMPRVYVGDGADRWQEAAGLSTQTVGPVVWAGDGFVLLGGTTSPRSYRSADGLQWAELGDVVPRGLMRLRWDGGQIVGVGWAGETARSADGRTWTSEFAGTWVDLPGVAVGNGRMVAVGQLGRVLWRECDRDRRPRPHLGRLRAD